VSSWGEQDEGVWVPECIRLRYVCYIIASLFEIDLCNCLSPTPVLHFAVLHFHDGWKTMLTKDG
jgi:hypothetical protein